MRHFASRQQRHSNMRLAPVAAALFLTVALFAQTQATEQQMKSVAYQGQRFNLSKSYANFDDYKDDQKNLTSAQVRRAESLMRSAKFGPSFKTSNELDTALATLEFPGYGLFYANQLGSHSDPKLELVYVEIPARGLNRYIALELQADGSLLVVADFVAVADPEIVRVTRTANGSLEFHQQSGTVVVPRYR
jgi:hypothetical protein